MGVTETYHESMPLDRAAGVEGGDQGAVIEVVELAADRDAVGRGA